MLFKEIVGHKDLKKSLINAINHGRVSHAQLFLGAEGSGNLALALAYAQYISCQNKQEEDACGVCPSCIKYQKLIHPDLHFVFPVATNDVVKKNPKSNDFLPFWRDFILKNAYPTFTSWQETINTGNKQLIINKDESIDILKKLSLKTYESEYKIMIIWYPEKLNTTASNKLLKIIEEPPEKTIFLFVAHQTEQIINTITSRTQLIKIGGIKPEEITPILMEKFNINDSKANEVARLSDGNYLNARKIIEQNEDDNEHFERFVTLMRIAFSGKVDLIIDWTEKIADRNVGREKQKQFLSYALHIFRESLICNYGNTHLERANLQENQFLNKFAPFIHGANCLDLIQLFNDAHYHIERNANPKILFLDVALKLTKLLRVKAPQEGI